MSCAYLAVSNIWLVFLGGLIAGYLIATVRNFLRE